MQQLEQRRQGLKGAAPAVMLIVKCVPHGDRHVLRHNDDLSDHLVGVLQRGREHERSVRRNHVIFPPFDQRPDAVVRFGLPPLILGAYFIVAVIKHDFRVLLREIAEKKPFGLYADHADSFRRSGKSRATAVCGNSARRPVCRISRRRREGLPRGQSRFAHETRRNCHFRS